MPGLKAPLLVKEVAGQGGGGGGGGGGKVGRVTIRVNCQKRLE